MAGHIQPVGTVLVPRQRVVRRSKNNKAAFKEIMQLAHENGVTRVAGQTAPDVLQEVLDRAVARWRWACGQLDNVPLDEFWVYKYDAQGNKLVEPNKWHKLERAAAEEVERVAGLVSTLGITERLVRVEEAKAVLLVRAVRAAAEEAGLDTEQVRALGAAMRRQLSEVEEEAE